MICVSGMGPGRERGSKSAMHMSFLVSSISLNIQMEKLKLQPSGDFSLRPGGSWGTLCSCPDSSPDFHATLGISLLSVLQLPLSQNKGIRIQLISTEGPMFPGGKNHWYTYVNGCDKQQFFPSSFDSFDVNQPLACSFHRMYVTFALFSKFRLLVIKARAGYQKITQLFFQHASEGLTGYDPQWSYQQLFIFS